MPLITSRHGFQILACEPEECACCGNPMPSRSSARGRPRQHCSADCREFSAAMSILFKYGGRVADKATTEAWKTQRGQLWQMMNMRSATKGVPKKPVAVAIIVLEENGSLTHHGHPFGQALHTSWNTAWRTVDGLTGSKVHRGMVRKTKARKYRPEGATHVLLVPRSLVEV